MLHETFLASSSERIHHAEVKEAMQRGELPVDAEAAAAVTLPPRARQATPFLKRL